MEADKSKLIVLTHKKVGNDLPPLLLNDVAIPLVTSITLLGGLIDQKLSFGGLVDHAVEKALKALGGLASLARSTRGISLRLARTLVISCVLTKLDYLSALWYKPGGSGAAITKLDAVQTSCAKFITGGFRNSGADALGFEAYLLPTALRLQRNSFRAASRLLTLPPSHPLHPHIHSARATLPPSHRSPLHRLLQSFPLLSPPLSLETISPTLIAPWERHHQPKTTVALTKDLAADSHQLLLDSSPPSSIFLYSDGSLLEGSVGAGVAVRVMQENDEGEMMAAYGEQYKGLGQHQTVYAGELDGITIALTAVHANGVRQPLPHTPYAAHLLIDNQSAVLGACDPFKGPGQHQRLANRSLYLQIERDLPHVDLQIHWVPGHVEIEGNELADALAKRGAELRFKEAVGSGEAGEREEDSEEDEGEEVEGVTRVQGRVGAGGTRRRKKRRRSEEVSPPVPGGNDLPKSVSAVNAEFDKGLKQRWAELWRTQGPGKLLRQVDLAPPSPHTLRLHDGLWRRHSSLLTQLRTGRSHLKADLHKTRSWPNNRCECGLPETRRHFFFECALYEEQRGRLVHAVGPDAYDLSSLLSDPKNLPHTLAFVISTRRFPRYHQELKARAKVERKGKG